MTVPGCLSIMTDRSINIIYRKFMLSNEQQGDNTITNSPISPTMHHIANPTTNHMKDSLQQQQKLKQKKARLIMEEINLKIKERRMRTRHLIEMGGLVAKAELDNLPATSLFGGLIHLKEELTKHPENEEYWSKVAKDILDQEEKDRSAIILKFESKPEQAIRTHIRQHGLKWNSLRQEWYGYITDMQSLKSGLIDVEYQLEVVQLEN